MVMINMKSSMGVLISRGYIEESEIIINYDTSKDILREQLVSKIPIERTKAALIIKKMKIKELVPNLIEALKIEKKLYSKIAIQKALISLKNESINKLIPYLGTIGKNQHCELPSKPFGKDNYPCPRDVVAMILIYCGINVIHNLLKRFNKLSRYQKLEAVDVLGHISFYQNNNESLPLLLDLYENNKNDSVMIWKIIRAFSSFNNDRVILILNEIINKSYQPQYVWEAERSLRLLKKRSG